MRRNDKQLGYPQTDYTGTKAAIEALTGVPEGSTAYATDTNEFGSYNATTWDWSKTLAASYITSGTMATARLGSGTANAYSFLSGDQTYKIPVLSETNAENIFGVSSPGSTSKFAASINGDPTNVSNSVVTFDTVTAGGVATITPLSSGQLGKITLFNLTRGTSALILSATGATITMTTNVYALGWRDNDSITTVSQTLSGGGLDWMDIEITSVLTGYSSTFVTMSINSATTNHVLRLHPFEATYSTAKQNTILSHVVNLTSYLFTLQPLITNKFCISWTGTPVAVQVKEYGKVI